MYEVFNGIRKVIANGFPEVPAYIKNNGGDFKRPSFFISFVGSNSVDINKLMYTDSMLFQVVFFSELDFYKNVDTEKQFDQYEKLKNLFQKKGYVEVGDRCPSITSLEGGPRGNEIYLTIGIDWHDSRYTPETGETADTLELDI